MREYELVFIVHPEVDEDDFAAVVQRVEELIKRYGGEVVEQTIWGLRKLAYPIKKQWEGQYVLMRIELEPQGVAQLEREFTLLEQVIRHLIVRIEQ